MSLAMLATLPAMVSAKRQRNAPSPPPLASVPASSPYSRYSSAGRPCSATLLAESDAASVIRWSYLAGAEALGVGPIEDALVAMLLGDGTEANGLDQAPGVHRGDKRLLRILEQ